MANINPSENKSMSKLMSFREFSVSLVFAKIYLVKIRDMVSDI